MAAWSALGEGLSPRVRGNPATETSAAFNSGSIPACAGEPSPATSRPPSNGVYPRVCGGTAQGAQRQPRLWGLSPRVRGNPRTGRTGCRPRGSIPACAGEPRRRDPRWTKGWVYPRVCGGTPWRGRAPPPAAGLSPRVRGNRLRAVAGDSGVGSIPACAGEPQRHPSRVGLGGVYPRVCGGTRPSVAHRGGRGGLSPRVRGNRDWRDADVDRAGSIPACAGEPLLASAIPAPRGVYPRVCGGTPPAVWPSA